MDNDQEVVREPFDDEESIYSTGRSPDNYDIYATAEILARRFQLDRTITNTDTAQQHPEDQNNQDQIDDGTSSENNSSTFIEDAKFAESFGIQLKTGDRKNELSYERLIKSTHFLQKDKPKPLIETSVTSDCIYHRGTYYQKGDIVSIYDQADGQIYFAQLVGFLQDQYCEKSASVHWLVPIKRTSREFFDPSAYKIGLIDPQLRKMDCMTFVRHCPHDYYMRKLYQSDSSNAIDRPVSHSLNQEKSNKGQHYIWTTMDPCRVPGYRPRA